VQDSAGRRGAYLFAYDLLEAVQSERREEAAARIPAARAEAQVQGWVEVEIVLECARLIGDLVSPSAVVAREDVTPLCRRAEAAGLTALLAVSLSIRALAAGPDAVALMADASRAVALLDDGSQPPLDRSTGYVVAAAAFNTLRLWELVDDLYACAQDLGELCEVPAMQAAIAASRVLTRVEWAAALLENGDRAECQALLRQAAAAVPAALAMDLPPLWRRDVEALHVVAQLLDGGTLADLLPDLEELRRSLVDDGDVEVLPLLDASVALAHWWAGDRRAAVAACERLALPASVTSGSQSFPSWVRAEVLAGTHSSSTDSATHASSAVRAQAAYATLLGRLRWQSRQAVLVAARTQIRAERWDADHARLVHAANTDTLTGLQNRRAFDGWLSQQEPSGPQVTALLLIDVDEFKGVNDGHGHDCGDEVLRQIGRLLHAAVRPGDLAVRHGGDEFAVLITDPGLTSSAAEHRARDLLDAIVKADWHAVAPGLSVTASIGMAVTRSGRDPLGPSELYRAADRALYAAKRESSGLVVAGPEAGVEELHPAVG
jgi:diguanylate cyclase (GGDEF)-like protein